MPLRVAEVDDGRKRPIDVGREGARALYAVPVFSVLQLLACAGPTDELAALRVQDADLDGIQLTTVEVLGGGVFGSADLNVIDTRGRFWSFPVRIRGGTVGAVVDISQTIDFGNNRALRLPEGPLTGDQLLGRYTGTGVGLVVGVGGTSWDLENADGVQLERGFFSVGVSIEAGKEWVRLGLGGDGGQTYDWEDFVDDTGAPWDTARPDSGSARDSTAAFELDEVGVGCGADTSAPPPRDEGPDRQSPDRATGGCSCEDTTGRACGCGTGPSGWGAWVWLLAFLALRRRSGARSVDECDTDDNWLRWSP